MSSNLSLDLLKLSLGVLAAYLAVATLFPTVIERLKEVVGSIEGDMVKREEYKRVYRRAVVAASFPVSGFFLGYGAVAFSGVTFLVYVAFSEVSCVGLTCLFLWLPYLGAVALSVGVIHLIVTTILILRLMSLASSSKMKELAEKGRKAKG